MKTLQHYIRVEQKVRLHDVNRYEHLADRDPMEAETVRQQIIDHLHLVDVRIQETLDLLRRVPRLEKKIRVQMGKLKSLLILFICDDIVYLNCTIDKNLCL